MHRAGRTARFQSDGRSVLFLAPSEMKIIDKFKESKVDVQFIKVNIFTHSISFFFFIVVYFDLMPIVYN